MEGKLDKQELVEEINELLGEELTPSEEKEMKLLPTILLVRLKELIQKQKLFLPKKE